MSSRIELVDVAPGGVDTVGPAAPDHRPLLRRIAAEALILTDQAEDVLCGIRSRENPGTLAPRGSRIVGRLCELRVEVPERCFETADEAIRAQLAMILYYEATALSGALDLMAEEWRSPRLRQEVENLGGFGEPTLRLERLYARLAPPGTAAERRAQAAAERT